MFTMVAYQVSTDSIGSIHRTGCKEIAKDAGRHSGIIHNLKATTLAEALAYYIDDEMVEMGYSADDVKVHPCTKQVSK